MRFLTTLRGTIFALVVVLAMGSSVFCQKKKPEASPDLTETFFANADANNDGILELEEVRQRAGVEKQAEFKQFVWDRAEFAAKYSGGLDVVSFLCADADDNKTVSKEEYRSFLERETKGKLPQPSAEDVAYWQNVQSTTEFLKLSETGDSDKDLKLSKDELGISDQDTARNKAFDNADADKSASLSIKEFKQYWIAFNSATGDNEAANFSLFKKQGRAWTLRSTPIPGESGTISYSFEVLAVNPVSAWLRVSRTLSTKVVTCLELRVCFSFGTHCWACQHPECKFVEEKRVNVSAGEFASREHELVGEGSTWRVSYSTEFPNLPICWTQNQLRLELATFSEKPAKVPGVKQPEPGLKKPISKRHLEGPPNWKLYTTSGRKWQREEHTVFRGEDKVLRILDCDISATGPEYATTRMRELDASGKPMPGKRGEFTEGRLNLTQKMWDQFMTVEETQRFPRTEWVTVPAGTFECYAFDYLPGYGNSGLSSQFHSQSLTTRWFSKVYPTLLVKEQFGQQYALLKSFQRDKNDDEKSPDPKRPAINPDGPYAGVTLDFTLFKTKGAKWTILATRASGGAINTGTATIEVQSTTETGATLKIAEFDKDKKPVGTPWTRHVTFDETCAHLIAWYPTDQVATIERIKVKAGEFDCNKVVFAYFKQKCTTWYSKRFPGLLVKQEYEEGSLKESSELIEATMPKEKPVVGEKVTPADWILFSKKGRKWTSRATRTKDGAKEITYLESEIFSASKESCELVTRDYDKDKKLIKGSENKQTIQFSEEEAAGWLRPPPGCILLRTEKIDAAGKNYECDVYEDKTSEPGVTTTIWLSKKWPGLTVKYTSNGNGVEFEAVLAEFKE